MAKYTTRDGREVDGPYKYEFPPCGPAEGVETLYGYVNNDGVWDRYEWFGGGKIYESGPESCSDLIPVPEPQPMNYETFPREVQWVRKKGISEDMSVAWIDVSGITASYHGIIPWSEFHKYEFLLDGKWVTL